MDHDTDLATIPTGTTVATLDDRPHTRSGGAHRRQATDSGGLVPLDRSWPTRVPATPVTVPVVVQRHDRALLATKLHIPRLRSGFVARPRLVERVADAAGRELTVVAAPAGFGKTAVLGDWARGHRRRVAWLSLDAGDNDPARFWSYVAAALDPHTPGLVGRVAGLLRGPQSPLLEAVTAAVINVCAQLDDEVVLVLDDYHVIDDRAVHDSFAFLLEHLPAQLRLVVASRSDPPLPLARLRARGQLAELRATDLRFTLDETAALLRAAADLDLPADSVAALSARTEGWAVGLQLAALSLAGRSDPAGFVAAFSGSHRFVLDYLSEEVLARQDEQVLDFLLETSVLDRLSGELCDAVTGRDDSRALLERIERANLFLVPLDDERRWWRYHHLFAELLRTRLHHDDPARVAALHRAAAAWYEAAGSADDAIGHALAAGDTDRAARLVERHVEEQILRRGEGATLSRWLAALPADLVRARPRLCVARAVAALVAGRADDAEPLLAAVEGAEPAIAGDAYEPSIERSASILTNVPAVIAVARADLARLRGDAVGEASFARRAAGLLTGQDRLLGTFVRYHEGVAAWMQGRLGDAERELAGVVAERFAAGEDYMAVRASYDLGGVQQARGMLDAAVDTYEHVLEVVAGSGRAVPPFAGMTRVGLAQVAYERDELDAALDHATAAVAQCRQLKYLPPLAAALAALARTRHALGDIDDAVDAIAHARRVTRDADMVDILDPAAAAHARLRLAAGETIASNTWARRRGIGPDDEPSYPREGDYLVLARLLLAERQPDRALGLLARLHDLAATHGRVRSLLEITLLQARARASDGDDAGVATALRDAVLLAAPEGHLRVLLDEGPAMAALLRRFLAGQQGGQGGATHEHLTRLIDAFDRCGLPIVPHPRRGAVVVPELLAQVTARELEVLGLLAAGKSNQMIADELFVTLDTVKKHVSHILDKLQAANRTEAVTRALDLRLVA